ncbi:MAG: RNA polymerase sigma factor (sigma-70 family) [Myxococcota bacterium]|jgi:RNA polymerase sigma factor (sigma-70 family)
MSATPEEWIVAIAQQRDRVAFASLYREIVPKIRAFLRRGGAGSDLVEELTQEIMLTIWRRANTFNPERGSAHSWVFTIARNRRIDHRRRQKWPQIDPEDPVLVPDTTPSLETRITQQQRARSLREALRRLPADQARVLNDVYLLGRPQKAVAEAYNVPLGTVKSRIRRALRRLQDEGVAL